MVAQPQWQTYSNTDLFDASRQASGAWQAPACTEAVLAVLLRQQATAFA
jgi:hypothetical protein